ncbi:hypothetical protein GIB67_042510 [Kingdonia uniflora]|uniref:BCD1 alpha/beta domain-containing protein n=1 Tax=Kingdonia uniflora TaxID=39325 RepID=A0A7J7M0Z8_9MAGN|nr:hypothetical protein GIB67_042510 [Kingdonia uniflora]
MTGYNCRKKVDENKSLCSVIENHLKPGPWNHQLKPFCKEQLECLKFFICKNPKGTKSPFRELDIKAPISRQLRNIIIMEYPIIHVFLPSSSIDFEVSKDQISLPPKFELKESLDEDATSPKGTYFKEEEIENGASPDPHFSDLMKYINPELVDDCSYPGITKSLLQELGIEQEGTFCDSNTMDVGFSEGRDYDFGQDLQNVYSDLIEETNPDGFLDLEGLFVDDEGEMANDELEEGEIP